MSIFIFIKSIFKKKILYLNNSGNNFRDFTYIDNIISYMVATYYKTNKQKKFFNVFNIGGEKTISIKNLVNKIEKFTGIKAKKKICRRLN